jgi:sugar lactone lactonase YvrE
VTPAWDVLASGYELAEAPRADGAGAVWFTDVLGGGVYRWTSRDGVTVAVPKRRGVGGLALHADGGVVVSGRDVVHVAPDGTNRTLWSPPPDITGLNDLCALPDGRVLVGALRFKPFAGESPIPGAFWLLGRDGAPAVPLVDDVDWPNGCGADDEHVYACDYSRGVVHVLAVPDTAASAGAPGGSAGPHVLWPTPSGEADGLAVDVEGGVWVAQPRASSLVRFAPGGSVDRVVDLTDVTPSSLAFDGATMYVTTIRSSSAPGALLRLDAPVRGHRHHPATI